MKKAALLFLTLIAFTITAGGCGGDSQGSSQSTATTASVKTGRIQKYVVGEEFPIYDYHNEETYRATVDKVVDPYDMPYKTAEERLRNSIMMDPKPGYKYVMINLSVSNPGKYPATYLTSDYLVWDERDHSAVFSGGTIGGSPDIWSGKELLPGDSIKTTLIYQLPDAAHPAVMEGRFAGEDRGQKISEINLS